MGISRSAAIGRSECIAAPIGRAGPLSRESGEGGKRVSVSATPPPYPPRLAVVELQAIAQGEAPNEAIRRGGPALDHLRPGLQLGIPGEQLFVDHQTVFARDENCREYRVELRQVACGTTRSTFVCAATGPV